MLRQAASVIDAVDGFCLFDVRAPDHSRRKKNHHG
jgi:hypothetical protein